MPTLSPRSKRLSSVLALLVTCVPARPALARDDLDAAGKSRVRAARTLRVAAVVRKSPNAPDVPFRACVELVFGAAGLTILPDGPEPADATLTIDARTEVYGTTYSDGVHRDTGGELGGRWTLRLRDGLQRTYVFSGKTAIASNVVGAGGNPLHFPFYDEFLKGVCVFVGRVYGPEAVLKAVENYRASPRTSDCSQVERAVELALPILGPEAVLPVLERLTDPQRKAATLADQALVEVLGRLGDVRALPTLISISKGQVPAGRAAEPFAMQQALEALGRIGDPSTYDYLAGIAVDPSHRHRFTARVGVARYRTPAAQALLLDLLEKATEPRDILFAISQSKNDLWVQPLIQYMRRHPKSAVEASIELSLLTGRRGAGWDPDDWQRWWDATGHVLPR